MIAIITGATGDIGEEFVKALLGEMDEIWAVGRSEEKLRALKERYGEKIVPVRADLSDMEEIMGLCRACIPCMQKGGRILNVASASAFQPNPYIALYAASKSFLLSFTRSLNVELPDVQCTAVCPGWVDTQMLGKSRDGKPVRYPGMVSPAKVAEAALRDSKKGKDVSVCSPLFRYLRLYSKLMPHRLVMRQWVRMIRKDIQR